MISIACCKKLHKNLGVLFTEKLKTCLLLNMSLGWQVKLSLSLAIENTLSLPVQHEPSLATEHVTSSCAGVICFYTNFRWKGRRVLVLSPLVCTIAAKTASNWMKHWSLLVPMWLNGLLYLHCKASAKRPTHKLCHWHWRSPTPLLLQRTCHHPQQATQYHL